MVANKYSKLEEILNPVFELATGRVRALRVPLVDQGTCKYFERQHRALQGPSLELLVRLERAGLLLRAH